MVVNVTLSPHHGLPGIGVLWGFGDRDELTAAGAEALCEGPAELPALCRRLLGERAVQH